MQKWEFQITSWLIFIILVPVLKPYFAKLWAEVEVCIQCSSNRIIRANVKSLIFSFLCFFFFFFHRSIYFSRLAVLVILNRLDDQHWIRFSCQQKWWSESIAPFIAKSSSTRGSHHHWVTLKILCSVFSSLWNLPTYVKLSFFFFVSRS